MNGYDFLEFDDSFYMPDGLLDLDELNSLPVRMHYYGDGMEDPNELYWTQYYVPGTHDYISFARRLIIGYPEAAMYVARYMQSLFTGVKFRPELVTVLKTKGSIPPHIDESNRISTINIGIRNSDCAITRYSNISNIDPNWTYKEAVCKDGHTYLLNTSKTHSVISMQREERFLFSYGLQYTYYQLVKMRN